MIQYCFRKSCLLFDTFYLFPSRPMIHWTHWRFSYENICTNRWTSFRVSFLGHCHPSPMVSKSSQSRLIAEVPSAEWRFTLLCRSFAKLHLRCRTRSKVTLVTLVILEIAQRWKNQGTCGRINMFRIWYRPFCGPIILSHSHVGICTTSNIIPQVTKSAKHQGIYNAHTKW